MACYYRLLELGGALSKNALADTMKMFGVKRSAVMAARRQHKAPLIEGMPLCGRFGDTGSSGANGAGAPTSGSGSGPNNYAI
jgi:hypothetical protein